MFLGLTHPLSLWMRSQWKKRKNIHSPPLCAWYKAPSPLRLFDWYCSYAAHRYFLRHFVPASSRVLMLGCGNSTMPSPLSKKQKLSVPASERSSIRHANGDCVARSQSRDEACEEEQGLIALVEHCGKEVDTIKQKLAHYQSMVSSSKC